MIEDSNPTPQKDPIAVDAEKALATALEDLVSNAPFRKIALQDQAGGFTSPGAGPCPDVSDWLRFAADDLASNALSGQELPGGKFTPSKRQQILAHAALCTGCLNRLRESQRVLLEETTSGEQASLQELASTTPQWQHRLAAELAQTPHGTGRAQHPFRFAWSFGAGLAAALILSSIGMLWWRNTSAPEKLLAEAYTQSRTSELRIPGAAFASVKPENHLRGGTTDREPAPLLSARATIERKLEKTPSDPHWLQMQARADMLEEHYDPAIDVFDRLLAAGPVTASLLLDDGMAYYLRGTATGSENDRATALDNLRRADELAPSDPVILFNEAIVMEDRGLVMNAVETWNRFLKFERDPKWQEEGRQRLQALEAKLSRVKTHESRMQQHLATPQSMRALAADPATLAGIDEEFSTTLLPRLLDAAYLLPGDRSRGSPCDETCAAARALLDALATSLQHNHQDSWLKEFLPSASSPIPTNYLSAAHALGQAIDADTRGKYAAAEAASLESRDLLRKLGNVAGAERAEVERAYALQRSYTFAQCHQAIASINAGRRGFAWIEAQAVALDAACDVRAGTAALSNPLIGQAAALARTSHYTLLELRAGNVMAMGAVESGDTESAWRLCMVPLRRFYEGDYPAFRIATTMGGIASVEDSTPRLQLDLLANREAFHLFSISGNSSYLAEMRELLIRAAFRAGSIAEAREQMGIAAAELAIGPGQRSSAGTQAESEIAMAQFYLDHGDVSNAATALDAAKRHMAGEDNPVQFRSYAIACGSLEIALEHHKAAEAILGPAIMKEELQAKGAGEQNIVFARQNRELYAALAGVWLSEGRPPDEILALWERYRLRILGLPVQVCANNRLDCLKSQIASTFDHWRQAKTRKTLVGQIVLRDRVLLYQFDGDRLTWSQQPIPRDELLSDATFLERVASSPATSQISVDQAARRMGDLLFGTTQTSPSPDGALAIESDPLLGNLPWAAVETAEGPIGLHLDLEESPSIVLDRNDVKREGKTLAATRPLIVGASVTTDGSPLLPEALEEARRVAGDSPNSNLLLGNEATEARVAALTRSASILHFAGHASQYDGATRLLLAPSGSTGDRPYLDSALFRKDPPRAARLVVFSACSSGKREEGWDHGMEDIVDTLASLGVPEVVATRWQIDSASAVPLMDVFYRGLASGRTVPQALTAARQSLAHDARFRHPYYWAAYYASGVGTTDLHEVFHGSSN
jgi:hypothetical protein